MTPPYLKGIVQTDFTPLSLIYLLIMSSFPCFSFFICHKGQGLTDMIGTFFIYLYETDQKQNQSDMVCKHQIPKFHYRIVYFEGVHVTTVLTLIPPSLCPIHTFLYAVLKSQVLQQHLAIFLKDLVSLCLKIQNCKSSGNLLDIIVSANLQNQCR